MEPYVAKGWFPRGSKPIILTGYEKAKFSVFGALSKDLFTAKITEEACNHETYLQFIRSLLRKYKKILIVVDGASYHFEKEHVQRFYKNKEEELIVLQLPPYSPELNPTEQVWKKLKKWLAITPWSTKEEFEQKLVLALNNPDFMAKLYDYYSP